MDAKLLSEMNRGYLQMIVLECLSDPIHGYGLIKKLRDLGYDSVEANTLYPLLCRFEKNGWASSEWALNDGQPQKKYTITAEGISVRTQLNEIWKMQCEIMMRVKGRMYDE